MKNKSVHARRVRLQGRQAARAPLASKRQARECFFDGICRLVWRPEISGTMAESDDPAAESVEMEVKIPEFLNYKTDCRLYSDLYPCGGYLYARPPFLVCFCQSAWKRHS